MRKRGLFGLVVTFIHDLIAPFDPEGDEWRVGRKSQRAPRYRSVQSAEESARPSPSELKQMYALAREWDGLDDETWEKIYRGELPAEDYMIVHAFPPQQDRFEGTTIVHASPNDYEEKIFSPHAQAEPTPMSLEKIVIVSEETVESAPESEEVISDESITDSGMEAESAEESSGESGEDNFGNDMDTSISESIEFDNPDMPDYMG
jgi:hypothetical protein